jgi:hypothetical protein
MAIFGLVVEALWSKEMSLQTYFFPLPSNKLFEPDLHQRASLAGSAAQ